MKHYIAWVLVLALTMAAALPAAAWGPRTQNAVVTTAMHLLSKSGEAPLSRLDGEIAAGTDVPLTEIEMAYPDLRTNPVNAVESEMALLVAARQRKVDAYYAYRLGMLGKVVALISAPLSDAPPTYRNLYYADVDRAINGITLKPSPRKEVDPKTYFTSLLDDLRVNNEMILKEYEDGKGFGGVAAATLEADASRSVAAVADIWWSVLTSRSASGAVSEVQLRQYVLDAYAFYIRRRNISEIDATGENYAKVTPITPDMRAKVGDMLLQAGLEDRAIVEYEKVMETAPERRDVVQKVADFYVARGEEALKNSKLEDARNAFTKAAQANPLHQTAEARRIEADTLIVERDSRMANQQAALQRAADLRDLSEQEVNNQRYAEAIALLLQAEAVYNEVNDEFPNESQQRARGQRELKNRLSQLKGSLTASALVYSGSGFGQDARIIAEAGVPGLEQDALGRILENQYRVHMDKLAKEMQAQMGKL